MLAWYNMWLTMTYDTKSYTSCQHKCPCHPEACKARQRSTQWQLPGHHFNLHHAADYDAERAHTVPEKLSQLRTSDSFFRQTMKNIQAGRILTPYSFSITAPQQTVKLRISD